MGLYGNKATCCLDDDPSSGRGISCDGEGVFEGNTSTGTPRQQLFVIEADRETEKVRLPEDTLQRIAALQEGMGKI